MKLFKIAGAFAALAVSMAVAAPANATIWLLNLTDAQSALPAPYGQVEVTQGVNALNFTVTLFDGLKFTDTGMAHSAFTFSLAGAPVVGYSGPAGFTFIRNPDMVQNSPFAFFDYAVTCSDTCRPSDGGYAGPLSFTITGAGPLFHRVMSLAMKIRSSGISVLCIQNEWLRSSRIRNSIP